MTSPSGTVARRNLLGPYSALSLFGVVAIGTASAAVLSRFREDNMLRRDAEGRRQFTYRVARHYDTANLYATGDQSHRQPAPLGCLWHSFHLPELLRLLAPSVDRQDWPRSGPASGRQYPRRSRNSVNRHRGGSADTTAEHVFPTAA